MDVGHCFIFKIVRSWQYSELACVLYKDTYYPYRHISKIRFTVLGNKIYVVGASHGWIFQSPGWIQSLQLKFSLPFLLQKLIFSLNKVQWQWQYRCETIFWPPYILTPGSIYRTIFWPRGQYIVTIFWPPSRCFDPPPNIVYKTVLLFMDNY